MTLHRVEDCPLRPPRLGKGRPPDCADCFYFDEDEGIDAEEARCIKAIPGFFRDEMPPPIGIPQSYAPLCATYQEKPHCAKCRPFDCNHP